MKLINKDTLVAEIEKRKTINEKSYIQAFLNSNDNRDIFGYKVQEDTDILSLIDTLEVKEVGIWKTVDNINSLQADKNKIYCVITPHKFVAKNKYLTAIVVNHPHDEDLLQWKCTEFPFVCYDMCEGDKYMQIV